MRHYLKKADIVLAVILIILCLAATGFAGAAGTAGLDAVVKVDGKLYGTYSLSDEKVIDIDTKYGHNELTIKDGKALMTDSDCPDGYCEKQYKKDGGINESNQTLVCLPHRVVVSVEGNDKGGISQKHETTNDSNSSENEPDAVTGTR